MNTSRRIVRKRRSFFARITTKGGEKTFPLGREKDRAIATYDRVLAALRIGRDHEWVRMALRDGRDPLGQSDPPIVTKTSDITVAEAAERWLTERVEPGLEGRNAAIIRSRVERALTPSMGAKTLASVRRTDCHAHHAYLRASRPDLKAGTIHHYLRDLRELLNWSEEVELIESSPWPKRRILPRVAKRPPDRVSEAEFQILTALPDSWGFTLRFLLTTGLRWGEACRARRRDIEDRHLLVRKSKSGKFRRVPLSRAIMEEIVSRGGDWIVPRQRKAPGGRSERSSSSFNTTVRRLVEKEASTAKDRRVFAGLAGFHAHQCRHTFACRYLGAGGTLTMLQEILGHSSVEQTQQYGRPDAKAIHADAERVFELWNREKRA